MSMRGVVRWGGVGALYLAAPVLVAAGMALGNTLEAVVGAVVLERVVGCRPSLARL